MTGNASLPALDSFKKNIHSQNGEDGVIEELLKRLGIGRNGRSRWCVEFGAWDGIHLSNTFHLVESQDWKAVYIEGDEARFDDLARTADRWPTITPVKAFISRYGSEARSLDKILSGTTIPRDFDLLSIDIDSYDLDVWESLREYEPKIVVIEINSRIRPGILRRHTPSTPGNSFTSTLTVGALKGYILVCHTGNMIFVRKDLAHLVKLEDKYLHLPESLFNPNWLPQSLLKSILSRIVPTRFRDIVKRIVRRNG